MELLSRFGKGFITLYLSLKFFIIIEWSVIRLDNPDLINDLSLLLRTDLLDPQVTRVGEVEPRVAVVGRPEGGPVRRILVEVVVVLPAAGGPRGDVDRGPGPGVWLGGVRTGHHRPVVDRQQSLVAVFMSPD